MWSPDKVLLMIKDKAETAFQTWIIACRLEHSNLSQIPAYLLFASILQCRMITLHRNFGSYIVKTRIFKIDSNKLL